ncbi:plasmid mobilization protein [Sunxiuqinia elliptica]|jgi:urease gamma subunit|uniref:Mobilization protein MobC n=1 Tax=Sunxiuqinia elliptica TaxID=655355 RepID=A0A4R6H175_9BACT|nr:plasmid mobilization relaxosome protein MobC [Sunxiuqinia elliptica]TDO01418.1 mobilization protein MobC [Sunxiuqinia elliptica]TDO57929.1 mobilization protein MobC [Sunxiuqinia elliptica]
MTFIKNKGGRPKLSNSEKRIAEIHIVCNKGDKTRIKELAKSYGLTMTEYILRKCFDENVSFNHVEFLKEIHVLGTELSRQGNNINQLAKYTNTLTIEKRLTPEIATRLEEILLEHIKKQEEVRIAFRTLIREMAK